MNEKQLLVKMILDRWEALIKNCDAKLDAVSDEQLYAAIKPGKNRGIYLLGHLIAVHDAMLGLLEVDEPKYQELFEPFVTTADHPNAEIPSASHLRALWKSQVVTLSDKLRGIPAEEWFQKHQAVSEADFRNEPHRNKLNILLTRTTHLSYHVGQIAYIK